jgi:hypothetical protein
MSEVFVPGRILLEALISSLSDCPNNLCSFKRLAVGDFGPSWSSAIGGGLGRRGELAGDIDMVAIFQ